MTTRRTPLAFALLSLVVGWAFLCAPSIASAQAPAAAAAGQTPQAVFRAGVEIARLDIRALDDKGRPVKDLKAEEIEVFEGGQRRPLRLFQHVAEPEGSYIEVARRTIGGEVSTNQGAPRGHLYVIVFDQNHITAGNEQRARLAAERFLTARIRPGDRVALYGLPGPGPNTGFSSNPRAVSAELISVRGSLERTGLTSTGTMSTYEAFQVVRGDANVRDRVALRVTQSAGTLDVLPTRLAQAMRASSSESTQMLNQFILDSARTVVDSADRDTRAFLLNFADVIRELAVIEGRKSIILISEGFYADNVAHEIEQVAAAAARASASIYSLDINRREVDLRAEEPAGGAQFAEIQNRLESLGNLAADTDGQLVPDAGNHIDLALNRIADTLQDYYVVGFEPDSKVLAERDRYHRVTVKTRRSGVTIRARTGFALKDPAASADKRQSINRVLAAPFPQPGVPIELTTYVLRGPARGLHRIMVAVQAELPLKSAAAASADVVFVAKDARDGRVTASGTDKMALPSKPREGGTTGTGRFNVQFEAPPGEYLMRVAIREPGGTVGSVDRRFEVRALDGADVTASDLVLGRRSDAMLPVRATARTDEAVSGALEVYAWRLEDLDRIHVAVELARIGESAIETSASARLLPAQPTTTGAKRTAEIALPLQGAAPGRYVVRAVVKAGSETVAELSRELELVPPGTPLDTEARPPAGRPTPRDVLGGEIGKNLLAALRSAAGSGAVVSAVDAASAGNWRQVGEALGKDPAAQGFAPDVLRGLAAFAEGGYDTAASQIDSALARAADREHQTAAMAAFVLGWVHAFAGRDLDAITAWRRSVILDRRLVPPYLALADAYVRRSEPSLAAQVLRDGLAAVPRSYELEKKLREIEQK